MGLVEGGCTVMLICEKCRVVTVLITKAEDLRETQEIGCR